MSRRDKIRFEFVESVPDQPQEGVVYVSTRFAIAIHKCCCGCGTEVVTPLSPAGWTLIFNGETISLHPSIGNWASPCKSHYWIQGNRVIWARKWSKKEIEAGRHQDRIAYERLYAGATEGVPVDGENSHSENREVVGWSARFKKFFTR